MVKVSRGGVALHIDRQTDRDNSDNNIIYTILNQHFILSYIKWWNIVYKNSILSSWVCLKNENSQMKMVSSLLCLLSCMCQHVNFHIISPSTFIVTKVTWEWFLSCVCEHVFFQIFSPRTFMVANVTWESFLFCMCQHVFF